MKKKSGKHYFEVSDLVNQFCSAFDSIIINRYIDKSSKTVDKSIRVQYKYMPKQRALWSIVNKAEHITVPLITVSVNSITRDDTRVFSKNLGHMIQEGDIDGAIDMLRPKRTVPKY